MKSKYVLLLLLITALMLSACVPGGIARKTVTNTAEIPTNTITLTPFLKPTSTFTHTPTPSPTLLAPTATYTPTPSNTPLPTLEPTQAAELLKTLLSEPVDCSAPCFWGITPGTTTLAEARAIFEHLGLEMASTTFGGKDFYGIRYDFDNELSIMVTLTVINGLVENLRVDLTPEKFQPGVPREWLAFSPETLIARYGEPSKVELDLIYGPRTSAFAMIMYFDAFDLIVQYGGYGIIEGTRICPLEDPYEDVRIWMGKDPVNPPGPLRRLEEVTSLTLAEFSALMTGEATKACFNLNEEALTP